MSGINSIAGYSNNIYFAPKAKNPPEIAKTLNFRGQDYPYYNPEPKNSHKGLRITLGTLVVAAGSIVGLGYAHKQNVLAKMSDGKVKDALYKYGKPAMETCYEWCSKTKQFGKESWDKIKNYFS